MRKQNVCNFANIRWASLLFFSFAHLVSAAPTATNVALFKTTSVSSFNSSSTNGAKAVDGNAATYWQTKNRSTNFAETITIDLGANENISRVVLDWNTSYATTYEVRVSANNLNYTKLYAVTNENGGVDTIDFTAVSARYVQLYTRAWANNRDRIRLNEMAVYRDDGLTPPPVSGSWSIVASPNLTYQTELRDIAVVGANDIWAVGQGSADYIHRTMIQRWDGGQWSIVASPNPSANGDMLYGVSALSGTDAWAVGTANDRATRIDAYRALILRWDGASWFSVSAPDVSGVGEELRAVTAASANAAWAVGTTVAAGSGVRKPLILFWNGSNWQVVANPAEFATSDGGLLDVVAIGENDVWAVGYISNVINNTSIQTPLAMHWDGAAWRVLSLSAVQSSLGGMDYLGASTLRSVTAHAANDIWAVGDAGGKTVTMHFDGKTWTLIKSPNDLQYDFSYLMGVSMASPTDVWAVGLSSTSSVNAAGSPVYTYRTLTMHWNGSNWSQITTPNVGSFLRGVAHVDGNNVWSVGNRLDYYSVPTSLILHYTAQ